jgi:hypothetical protein
MVMPLFPSGRATRAADVYSPRLRFYPNSVRFSIPSKKATEAARTAKH